ncbi:ABC transporter ATP-binding protein [Geminicoccaceae bacterium 1502E]|nr:ABC transporter ATP-binding protein [Geminicoccaceae bacterium 1502E]
MLELVGVEAGYAGVPVLLGIDLEIGRGEVVALLGRNGMGKTTTVMTAMGHVRPTAGRILLAGQDVTFRPPHAIARLGIGLVPEGRQIFASLTVRENLVATARPAPGGWDLARVLALFPRLAERAGQAGDRLSGGEQQMLAIGRALMTNPLLLVLDEATEGLAPLVRREIWRVLLRLKEEGLAILVIDKNLGALRRIADRHYVLEKGRIVWQGSARALDDEPAVIERHIGV